MYKRQILGCFGVVSGSVISGEGDMRPADSAATARVAGTVRFGDVGMLPPLPRRFRLGTGWKPVSYTHLDVYKRQVMYLVTKCVH